MTGSPDFEIVTDRPLRKRGRVPASYHSAGWVEPELYSEPISAWERLMVRRKDHDDIQRFIARYERGDTCQGWSLETDWAGELDAEDDSVSREAERDPYAFDLETMKAVARSLPEHPAVTALKARNALDAAQDSKHDEVTRAQTVLRKHARRDRLLEGRVRDGRGRPLGTDRVKGQLSLWPDL